MKSIKNYLPLVIYLLGALLFSFLTFRSFLFKMVFAVLLCLFTSAFFLAFRHYLEKSCSKEKAMSFLTFFFSAYPFSQKENGFELSEVLFDEKAEKENDFGVFYQTYIAYKKGEGNCDLLPYLKDQAQKEREAEIIKIQRGHSFCSILYLLEGYQFLICLLSFLFGNDYEPFENSLFQIGYAFCFVLPLIYLSCILLIWSQKDGNKKF